MQIRKLFTWPGDLSLRFLLWRDRLEEGNPIFNIFYFLLVPFALFAIIVMMCADLVDDI